MLRWWMLACALAGLAQLVALPIARAENLDVGGVARSYELFVPPTVPARAPLLLVLHGRFGTPAQVRDSTGFDAEARARGFVVAYPAAIDGRFTDLRDETLPVAQRQADHHDVAFILALIDALAARDVVDPARVFVVGHSNGGFLALTLLCTRAERFRGVAAVAAHLPETACAPARPIAVLLAQGTKDPLVPFAGGGIGPRGARGFVRSADETFRLLRVSNRCTGVDVLPPVDRVPSDGTVLRTERGTGCSAPVERDVVEGGGHAWPGARGSLMKDLTAELNETARVAAFFFGTATP